MHLVLHVNQPVRDDPKRCFGLMSNPLIELTAQDSGKLLSDHRQQYGGGDW